MDKVLLSVSIALIAGLLMTRVFKPLKLPSVTAYLIAGVLKLNNIEEYKTSGYGCIEQTDPLLAMALGLRRDKSLATPKLLAAKTVEVLNDLK